MIKQNPLESGTKLFAASGYWIRQIICSPENKKISIDIHRLYQKQCQLKW